MNTSPPARSRRAKAMALASALPWMGVPALALLALLGMRGVPDGMSRPTDWSPAVRSAAAQISDEVYIHLPFVIRAFDVAVLPRVPTSVPTDTATPTPTTIPTDTPTPLPTERPGPAACTAPLAERLEVSAVDTDDLGVVRPGPRDFFTGQPILAVSHDEERSAIAWPASDGTIRVTPLLLFGQRDGEDVVIEGQSLHGFTAHPDGGGALLVRRDRTMVLVGYGPDGTIRFETDIVPATPATGVGSKWIDDWTHEGRLVWTGSGYTAYFGHTQQWSDGPHQGDLLWHFDAAGTKISRAPEEHPEWDWGCSHSLDVRLAHHRRSDVICPVCLSDCFPEKAILHTHRTRVSSEPSGDCLGGSDARLGGLVATEEGFALTYASKVGRASRDIALITISTTGAVGRPVWLTNTPGVDESSAHLAHYGPDHFLAGWKDDAGLHVAVVSHAGAIVEGPALIDADIERRDDFIGTRYGDVIWGYADASGRNLYQAVVTYCIPESED